MKAHSSHYPFKKNTLNTVIGFAHVNFESHISVIPFRPRVKGVESLIGNKNVIYYKPTRNECALSWRDDVMKDLFESVSKHLSNNFIENIAKAYESEITNFEGSFLFWE